MHDLESSAEAVYRDASGFDHEGLRQGRDFDDLDEEEIDKVRELESKCLSSSGAQHAEFVDKLIKYKKN